MIDRQFVSVGGRDIHLLMAGRGAPVLLLHGSPNSATTLTPLIEHLAEEFLVIAPDTPGNGESDPLPGSPSDTGSYAEAQIELLDALGIQQVGAYGFHTGACFAAELARRFPQRVTALVADGLPLWTEQEAVQLDEHYLQTVTPRPSGEHLARIWSRAIDQNWFFPWHIQSGRRIAYDLGEVDRLHSRAMDFLVAGDNYRAPYAAALRADGAGRIGAVTVPVLVTCDPADVLMEHVPRLASQDNVTVDAGLVAAERFARISTFLRQYPADTATPTIESGSKRYVRLAGAQLFVVGAGEELWLHPAGCSSAYQPNSAANLRIDLPGHGLTTLPCPANRDDLLSLVSDAITALGCRQVSGEGLGARLAAAAIGSGQLGAPADIDVPDIRPRWDGGHLHAAWHFCRFRSQYRNWADRRASERNELPLPDTSQLHQQTIDMLRAGQDTLDRTLGFL